jgi:amino-acid N-acetyltransferase
MYYSAMSRISEETKSFVNWFRSAAPYINAFRGRTFVVSFGGELLSEGGFHRLASDVALLNSLGVRLVLVHGARPQIEERLRDSGARIHYVAGRRVTDDAALVCVKEAAGTVRVEVEAQLSMGLPNSPMAGSKIRVRSGNFVVARPLGVRDGVDYGHTGEVRRVDVHAIQQTLAEGAMVLLSPLGYSPTGEVFNLYAEDVATAVARELRADKLLFLVDGDGVLDEEGGLIRQLLLAEARELVGQGNAAGSEDVLRCLNYAVAACSNGVRRAHLINRQIDGALLQELYTRDGVGTLVTGEQYEGLRQATIEDVGGILELIEPLEREGLLVRRSRELLEVEIGHFFVIERDGMVIASAALYPFAAEGVAELACLAVHRDYAGQGRGRALLDYLQRQAGQSGIHRIFVLTTRSAHWFLENGFVESDIEQLPVQKKALYNYQRNSKIFIKQLG